MIKVLDFVAGCTTAQLMARVQAFRDALSAHASTVGVAAPRESDLIEELARSGDAVMVVASLQYRTTDGHRVILHSADDDLTGLTDQPPPPFSSWDSAAGAWVPDLAKAKAAKVAELAAEREKQIASGVVYNGHIYQTDPTAVRNIMGVQARINAGLALPVGFSWRTADNVDVPFVTPDVLALHDAVVQAGWGAYEKYRTLRAQVDAATTPAQVGAIAW